MQFSVLGQVTAVHPDGTASDLGSTKVRTLLAVLLTGANRIVSIGRISEALWDSTPPRSSRNLISGYVSTLRQRLTLTTTTRLITLSDGYVLHAPSIAIDLLQFYELSARGLRQARTGRHAASASSLRTALNLWTGPAFSDVAPGWLTTVCAPQLNDYRRVVLQERCAADLASGRHHEVMQELTALLFDDPLQEGLWELLMEAHMRCGSRSAALDAYSRCRRVLVSELGLEPGKRLRELHGAVLRDEWTAPPQREYQVAEPDGEPAVDTVASVLDEVRAIRAQLGSLEQQIAEVLRPNPRVMSATEPDRRY